MHTYGIKELIIILLCYSCSITKYDIFVGADQERVDRVASLY